MTKRPLLVLLVIIAAAGAGGSYHFYRQYNALKANPNLVAQKEADTLVAAAGKLIELPKGETPTVATILDETKLKSQPFFKNGQNGDKLLAYNAAMVAILYRPATNKIINVAPITISPPQTAAVQGAATTTSLRIAYYNGTATAGVAAQAEKTIKGKYPNWQTTTLTNAAKKDYQGALVVDLTGSHGQQASDAAQLLGGKTGSLPQGETAPDADLLIIAGK